MRNHSGLAVAMAAMLAATSAPALSAAGLQVKAQAGGVTGVAEQVAPADPAAHTLDFRVSLDTHSANLGFDMVKVATLLDDTGASIAAEGWTGGKGGHHLSGILSFPSANLQKAASFTLVLKGAAGGKDLIFKWGGPVAFVGPTGVRAPAPGGR